MTGFAGNPSRAVRQLLADWRSAGLTYMPRFELPPVEGAEGGAGIEPPAPVDPNTGADQCSSEERRLPKPRSGGEGRAASAVEATGNSASEADLSAPASSAQPGMASALSRSDREQQLATLAHTVSQCLRCPELAGARTQTVFGVGNPQASVMFVGEAPGAEEDAQGEPFVGMAGQLLNKIIEACGWKRSDLYICNILRCRPPGNRNPNPQEAANCREFLDAQIRLVDPDYLVCWGSVAAQNLLGETTPIGRLRQKWFRYGRAKVLCTYHPSYLLRNPAAKKPVWEDMRFLLADMGLQPPT